MTQYLKIFRQKKNQSIIALSLVLITSLILGYFYFSQKKTSFPPTEINLSSFVAQLEKQLNLASDFEPKLGFTQKEYLNKTKGIAWLLNDYYSIKQIKFDSNSNNLKAIFPSGILGLKKASCLGSALWLHLASQGDLNLILLPDHIVLQDKQGRFYEPNRAGYSYSREEYQNKYSKKKWTGFEWTPLNTDQTKGILLFQVANALAYTKNIEALDYYKEALRYFPNFYPINENHEYWQRTLL